VVLTPAGEVLYRYAKKILSLRDRSIQEIQHFLGELSGSCCIAASTIPGEYLLPPVLADFHQHYPKVKVTLSIADTERVIKNVAEGTHLLGMVGGIRNDKGLTFIPIHKEELILALPSNHPVAHKDHVNASDLAEIPMILRERGSGTRVAFEKGLKKLGMTLDSLKVVAELGSTTALKEGMKAGAGAAVISPRAVVDEVKWGVIKTFKIADIPLERFFYLVKKSRRTLPPTAEKLEKFIISHFSEEL
jgi:DNA-binding transcriptional LysR family regulator